MITQEVMNISQKMPPKHRKILKLSALYGAIWLIIYWITSTRIDPDFGWHLAGGRYIATHGIPLHDIYSFTMPNFEWVNHEWLNDIFLSKIYAAGGYTLASAVYTSIWTLAIFLASRKHLWFSGLLAAFALLPYAGVRPIAWTALSLALLERLLAGRKWPHYIGIISLFLVWANIHGSFALGLIILWAVAILRRPIDWRLIATSVTASLITLINPYGWHVYVEILRTMGDTALHRRIIEWQPMDGKIAFWVFAILLVSAFIMSETRKFQLKFILPAGLLAMSVSATRHAVLFIIASLRYLEEYGTRTLAQLPSRYRAAATGAGIALLIGLVVTDTPRTITLDPNEYPSQAVSYLKNYPCSGNIFAEYAMGGYLIWQLPGTKTYIDGRMPSWTDDNGSIFTRYIRLYDEPDYRSAEFKRYNVTCVLISKSFQTLKYRDKTASVFSDNLTGQGWKVVWSDDKAILLIKN